MEVTSVLIKLLLLVILAAVSVKVDAQTNESLPDLFIGKVSKASEVVGGVSITVPIINLGWENATDVLVSLTPVDGNITFQAHTILPLVPGFLNETNQFSVPATIFIETAQLEFVVDENLVLKVDGDDLIKEHSEENNDLPFVFPNAVTYLDSLAELTVNTFSAQTVAIVHVSNSFLGMGAAEVEMALRGLNGDLNISDSSFDNNTDIANFVSSMLSSTPLLDVVIVLGRLEPTFEFLAELVITAAVTHPDLQILLSNDLITPTFATKLKSLSGKGLEVLPPIAGICYEGQTPLTVCQITNYLAVPGLVISMAALPPPVNPGSRGRRHLDDDEDRFVDQVKKLLEDPENQDLLEEAIAEAKKLRDALDKIKKKYSKFKKIKKLLDVFIRTGEVLDAAEQAQALADVLESMSGLIPLPPGVDSFMEYYVEAIKSISKALSVISENIYRRDKSVNQVTTPQVWPGGLDMWALYCYCKFDDCVVQWVLANREMLAFVFGEDPVQYDSVTSFWVLGLYWWNEVDQEHMKDVLTKPENLKILKKVLYGNADPNCPKDSIKRRRKNCPKKKKKKKKKKN